MSSTTRPPPTHVRYYVLGALCIAAVIAYIHRGCLAVPKTSIRDDLGLENWQMDTILGAFFWGYAVFQIPGGWIGDRWGTRRSLPLFMIIWSTSVVLMAFADNFEVFWSLHFVNGMAQAGIFPCSVKSFSKWFPRSQRALPNGAIASFMSVGASLGNFTTGLILRQLSWDVMLLYLAIPGFLFAVFLLLWFRDQPEEHAWVNDAEREFIAASAETSTNISEREPLPWRILLTSPRMALICAQQFFRAAAYIFYTTQFPTFLRETRGVSQAESGELAAIPPLGVVAAGLVGGIVMDFILRKTGSMRWSRKGIAIGGTLGGGVFLLCGYLSTNLYVAIGFMTLSMFCAGLTGPAGYTITVDQGGKHVATVFSIMNTAGNIGAALYPYLLGELVRATAWKYALVYTAVLYFAAALCWAFLEVRGSIFDREKP